jgi:hypothetical protein
MACEICAAFDRELHELEATIGVEMERRERADFVSTQEEQESLHALEGLVAELTKTKTLYGRRRVKVHEGFS